MADGADIPVSLVVAMGRNRVIGRGGGLPWRLPSDLARFKALTLGKPVVMGRKTFQSIGRPLPGRANIVITRDPQVLAPGCRVVSGLDPALGAGRQIARETGAEEVCVIGGAEIYAQALPLAHILHLTEVDAAPDGDAWFAPLDPAQWQEVARETVAPGPRDDCGFTVRRLERVKA
jgi:dihydrofolate reductase